MSRIVAHKRVTRVRVEDDGVRVAERSDALSVEEPLEIRVGGTPLTITMRTPGHDVELAAGFLVSEGVITAASHFRGAIHCGGPGTGGVLDPDTETGNTYNVLDVTLAPGVPLPDTDLSRNFYTTSSCGLCGKASIEAVETVSAFDVSQDPATIGVEELLALPERLRERQRMFDQTGGVHAAALFDAATGEMLVLREDVGRHNAVDKVVGWGILNGRLPLTGTVLQVSGRASFELVQKAAMAGIPILSAVSAPSSLAVELAASAGVTLAGFVREPRLNVYTGPHRIVGATI
ncbi:formate dehydrogenase accessory sulfurtransferase FdhD [Agromyces aerolatus]|uniref:formate dehydrogenase accessory sulfurtransferase FdhD n=1 Tax=Agromyces sp. LY-1074 TaxID=3074080 RepID=UPI00285C1F8D|nr:MULTISPECIES: formate dehydrogenase accessory sulfurtransferase FdhD [unclassified Agromyces]MDR5698790.1 formate dehydrogenase accessory sulfurtransferase FdhD [Agromyces sp. LY-1074]MDR5705432.1 formate dehydrogenase accessory sulfurtransferase FdhD [Agromyces sp. LY-1358]